MLSRWPIRDGRSAVTDDPALAKGVNMVGGKVTLRGRGKGMEPALHSVERSAIKDMLLQAVGIGLRC